MAVGGVPQNRHDMERQKLPVNPMAGEEAETIVAKMMSAPPAVVAKAKAIYE
jgi:hypothetical protein